MGNDRVGPPDFRKVERRHIYLVHRTRRGFRDVLTREVADLDLNPTLCLILELLASAGETSAAELARAAFVTPQALTTSLRTLEQRGLVERAESLSYGRVRATRLTPAGRTLADVVRRRVQALERRALSALTPEDQKTFSSLLTKYAEAWERAAGEPPRHRR